MRKIIHGPVGGVLTAFLVVVLVAANVVLLRGQSCPGLPDRTCCKTCGASDVVNTALRECFYGGDYYYCYVTSCSLHYPCPYPISDHTNDECSGTWECF